MPDGLIEGEVSGTAIEEKKNKSWREKILDKKIYTNYVSRAFVHVVVVQIDRCQIFRCRSRLSLSLDGPASHALCPRLVHHVVENVPLGRRMVLLLKDLCRDLILLRLLPIILLGNVVVVADYRCRVATVIETIP